MNTEEVLYRALRKLKVLNKNLTIQGDRKAVPEHYSNAGHTKKSFCSCFTFVQDSMSKHLEHLRAKIQYTEILWPQIQKPSFILAQELGQWLSVLEQMAHALNSIPLLQWSTTQQQSGQCQPQLCLSTLDEILRFPLPQQIKHLRRNSTYRTPKFNSSTTSQQIQIHPSCKKAQNPLRAIFSSPTPPNNSSTASTLQYLLCPCVRYYATNVDLCHFIAATSTEKLHSIPLVLRKTKMGTTTFLNPLLQPAYCQNWGGMMLLTSVSDLPLARCPTFHADFPRTH